MTASRLRSALYFAPCYFAATVGYGLASLLCSPWDPDGRRQHRIAQGWARRLLRIAGVGVTVVGRQHLEPFLDGRPCVLVCNHLSYMDVPVLFAELPLQFRILARKGLFRIPFLGGHLQRGHHLPVDQENPRAALRSLMQAAGRVAAGLPVFVFPEAGRSFDGELREFVHGAFFLALQAQVPIVPLVLAGTWELLRPGTMDLRPRAITLVVGAPVETCGLSRSAAEALSLQVNAQMKATYAEYRNRAALFGPAVADRIH